ncbi:MAG: 50S ribosomal protein L5 [Verrucomicrobiales bacterium]|nr:50S ribosomal protein L5 [Verrucomicrobiales bacterium]
MSKAVPNLQKHYQEKVVPFLHKKLGCTNIHQVPRLEKVVVNCSVGSQDDRKQAVQDAVADVTAITGQKPVITKSKNSISNFKLRDGEAVGVKVTLRGRIMYEFLERLIKIAIPVIRDFRGVSHKAFDGNGNYTLGVADQSIFPEIKIDEIKRSLGFDVCIVTSATCDDEGRELLRAMGMPFRDQKAGSAGKTDSGEAAA